tara:strand:- start:406 stop:894 length:489 start_codon:yes stop_codon:yes gene_type:complete
MAHFAKLDENNKVLSVINVGNDVVAYNGDPAGETYCTKLLGGTWKQTSYNTRNGVHYDPNSWTPSADQSLAFRWNYAGPDFTYDAVNDVFYAPQPFPSWTLDDQYVWQAPVAKPTVVVDGNGDLIEYNWDEVNQRWEGNPIVNDVIDPSVTYIWNPATSSWN